MDTLQTKEKNVLATLLEFDKLCFLSIDPNFICLEWNKGMEKVTGINGKEILHQNILKKFPDLINSSHLKHIQGAFHKKEEYLESASFYPFIKSEKENYSISYLPILNDQNNSEACLIVCNVKNETQERYKSLTENTKAGIWLLNPEGLTEYVNPMMCELLGIRTANEVISKSFLPYFTKESQERVKTELKKRLDNISSTYEVELLNIHGEKKNVMIHGTPLLSKDGKLEGMIGTFLDISERILSEIELKKSEERFRSLFEKTLTPIGISRNGEHLLVNDAYVKVYKYDSPDELIGTSIYNLYDPSDHEKVKRRIQERSEGKEIPISYELTGVRKDGTKFLFNVEVSHIELPDGMATALFVKDISEQKQTEVALKASEAKFRGIFESNMVGITFTNYEVQIVDANRKFLNLIQYAKEDIVQGLYWHKLTPPEYVEKDQKATEEYLEKGFITPYEKELIRKDGTRIPVLIAAAPLSKEEQLGVSFIIDISDLKQSKEETNKVANELSTFLYMASHDLKGPLASVIGLTNVAGNDIEDPKAIEYINLIQECTLKLDRSLMNFLKIIKIKNNIIDHVEISFNKLIEEIISSFIHQASFSNAEFSIDNSLHSAFYSDADLIKSVIQNLVENSVKYQTRLRKPVIKIKIHETEHEIIIAVEDNGRGIDENIKDKIFNIFYRGDITSKGSGLGLYIVKSAVEKLGGAVYAHNKPEGGSIFSVRLPKTRSMI